MGKDSVRVNPGLPQHVQAARLGWKCTRGQLETMISDGEGTPAQALRYEENPVR